MPEQQKPENIPYVVYELQQAREEREKKRLWVIILVLVGLLFLSNMGWLAYESQYDSFMYEQDGSGVNNIGTNILGGIRNEPARQNQEEAVGGQGG